MLLLVKIIVTILLIGALYIINHLGLLYYDEDKKYWHRIIYILCYLVADAAMIWFGIQFWLI